MTRVSGGRPGTTVAAATWVAAVVGIVALAYRPALDNDFWSDDLHWVEGAVRARGDRALWFSTGIFSNHLNPTVHVTMSLDLARGGGSPRPFMETNLAVHLLAAIAVALVGSELLGGPLAGALATTFWATSALVSEPVLWSSARVHSLAALFELLALLAVLRHADGGGAAWAVAGAVAFVLALGAKETAVAFVAVLAVAALVDREGRFRPRIGLVAFCGLAALAFTLYRARHFVVPPMGSGWARMAQKLLFALEGLFLPGVRDAGAAVTGIGAAMFAALAVAACVRRDRGAILAALMVAVPLAVTLPRPYHSSRYDYLPLAGASILAVATLRALLWRLPAPRRRWATGAATAVALLAFVPVQLASIGREERDYDALGRATRAMIDRYAPALRRVPCPGRLAFVDASPDLVTPLAHQVFFEGGMPKLIQVRARGVGRMALPHVLVTIARLGHEPACACVEDRSTAPPDAVVSFEPEGARLLPPEHPVPPAAPRGRLAPLPPP